ncbi:hypothetical protein V6N11_018607 [Hibiscus sabdariffa]|uniref:Uncharacterized protein n=1 Tax=Hibiscus sabdariffa TaxID=183260 RepID=A0ABR2N8D3_9ROSI
MLPADGYLCIDNEVVTDIIPKPIMEIEAHVPEDNVVSENDVSEDNDVSDNIPDAVVSESISQVQHAPRGRRVKGVIRVQGNSSFSGRERLGFFLMGDCELLLGQGRIICEILMALAKVGNKLIAHREP